MTTIDPWAFSADGLSFGTFAHSVEVLRGIESVPARRSRRLTAFGRHGEIPRFDAYFAAKTLTLAVTIGPWDEDGVADHPSGFFGELRDNWEAMAAILSKRHAPIQLQRKVPDGDGDPVTLQADATVGRMVEVSGSTTVWKVLVEFILPYPFWHELPKVTRSAATSHSFTTGGTAPINDMVLTFSGDGTLTYGSTKIGVAGSTGAVTVDVGKRKAFQGGNVDMSVLRLADAADNWMEWPAKTAISLTSTVGVAVEYYNARN